MTITQLKYVLAVAEHQNFTKAAEKCFVTQPTLSMQIQKLEDQLEVQIFDRSKKPIELTEVGRKIVLQSKNIVNEADRINVFGLLNINYYLFANLHIGYVPK